MYRFFSILLLTGVAALLLIQITGCEGVSGPRGDEGLPGSPGPDYQSPIPANRFFSLAIVNKTYKNHNGAPKLYLSFDGKHAAAGDTVVSVLIPEGQQPPRVDGIDDGSSEWGDVFTEIRLLKAAGDFNFIESAQVRSAYDEEYIYFQVKWTEVENAEFGLTVVENNNPEHWVYPVGGTGNPKRWNRVISGEDRLLMLFEITNVTRFDNDGCFVTCHTSGDNPLTNYHATRGARERMDIWMWGAGSTNYTGYAFDGYLTSQRGGLGIRTDLGIPLNFPNRFQAAAGADTTDRPLYQSVDDPNSDSGYPLWDWKISRVSTTGWTAGSTVPGYVSLIPSGSAADISAVGKYDDGTWTVELKRKRRTGNGDDTQF